MTQSCRLPLDPVVATTSGLCSSQENQKVASIAGNIVAPFKMRNYIQGTTQDNAKKIMTLISQNNETLPAMLATALDLIEPRLLHWIDLQSDRDYSNAQRPARRSDTSLVASLTIICHARSRRGEGRSYIVLINQGRGIEHQGMPIPPVSAAEISKAMDRFDKELPATPSWRKVRHRAGREALAR
jgi:hypothetical protein